VPHTFPVVKKCPTVVPNDVDRYIVPAEQFVPYYRKDLYGTLVMVVDEWIIIGENGDEFTVELAENGDRVYTRNKKQ